MLQNGSLTTGILSFLLLLHTCIQHYSLFGQTISMILQPLLIAVCLVLTSCSRKSKAWARTCIQHTLSSKPSFYRTVIMQLLKSVPKTQIQTLAIHNAALYPASLVPYICIHDLFNHEHHLGLAHQYCFLTQTLPPTIESNCQEQSCQINNPQYIIPQVFFSFAKLTPQKRSSSNGASLETATEIAKWWVKRALIPAPHPSRFTR